MAMTSESNDKTRRRSPMNRLLPTPLSKAVLAVALIATVFVATNKRNAVASTSATASSSIQRGTVAWDHLEEGEEGAIDYLYEAPAEGTKIKGILFLAHGCKHSVTDWWPADTKVCKDCIGLPEERAIVSLALEKYSFLAVAMSSVNRSSKCWSHKDQDGVARVLVKLQKELSGVPLYTFGASSGGSFVEGKLGLEIKERGGKLSGYISEIMAKAVKNPPTTPCVYITMNRDTDRDKKAATIVKSLTDIPAKHIRLDPLEMHSSFFSDRIEEMEPDVSKKIVKALQNAGYLDDKKRLVEDPRTSDWRSIVAPLVSGKKDSLQADASPISEVLNVAWSYHEMTRDGVEEALDFLVKQK